MRSHDNTFDDLPTRYDTTCPDGGAAVLPSLADVHASAESGLPTDAESDLPTLPTQWERIEFDDGEEPTPEGLREQVLADVKAYYREQDTEWFTAPPSEAFIESQFFSFDFLEGARAVEHYWVNKPFAFVSILYDEAESEFVYHVSEPTLDGFEDYVRTDLTKVLRNSLLYRPLGTSGDREAVFEREAVDVITEHAATVEDGSLHKLLYYLVRDFVAYGKIDPLMRDPRIEDISCDGSDIPVFVYHSAYRDLETNVSFGGGELTSFTVRLAQRAGKQISISDPLVDASLADGSRVQLTLGTDISTRGSNFTIRKFSEDPYSPVDLVRWNTFSVEQMAYFWLAIENNKSLLIAGGTGSGKTTSMNAISFFIPGKSKVVSIEDTREITLPHDNWIQSVTRDTFTADGRGEVSMYSLLQAALRQRPEYLLVGEIRTEQRVALTFFHAIATGHTAYSTFHGDSVEGVLNRLRNEPLGVPEQMLEGLDVISIQKQLFMGEDRVRRNVDVVEVDCTDEGEVLVNEVFKRDPRTDVHERVGESTVLGEIALERGWTDERVQDELARRARLLRWLVDSGVEDYREVAATIQAYLKDPEGVMAAVDVDVDADADVDIDVDVDVDVAETLPAVLRDVDVSADGSDGAGGADDVDPFSVFEPAPGGVSVAPAETDADANETDTTDAGTGERP